MLLEKELKDKLLNGEKITMNINGITVWAKDRGDGIVSKDLIFTSWFKDGSLTSMGIHKDNFSKSRIQSLM